MPFETPREEFDVIPLGRGHVQLETDIVYYDEKAGKRYVVHNGFICDLASYPRLARPFFDRLGNSMRPAVLHDYMYAEKPCSKATADRIFREALKEDGAGWLSRWVSWAGVAVGGWLAWMDE